MNKCIMNNALILIRILSGRVDVLTSNPWHFNRGSGLFVCFGEGVFVCLVGFKQVFEKGLKNQLSILP